MQNPTLEVVAVGDTFLTPSKYFITVLAADPIATRFGQPDRVLTVRVVNPQQTVDSHRTVLWYSQVVSK